MDRTSGRCLVKRSSFKPRGQTLSQRTKLKGKRAMPLVAKATGKMLTKKGPLRDPEHLVRVRSLACIICGWDATEAHHIRECFPRSMGVRIGDDKTLPMCRKHHNELHRSSRTFWEGRAHVPVDFAAALYAETLARRNREGRAPSLSQQR